MMLSHSRRTAKWLPAASLAGLLALTSGCAVPTLAWRPVAAPLWPHWRSAAIPDRYPLGSVTRAHMHTMQTNAEAYDFVFHRNEFVGETAELTPEGKDHILEVAARMRGAPFPVIVERFENNGNPQLDYERRQTVVAVLSDLGNADAEQRVFVNIPYDRGRSSITGEMDYYRFIGGRGGNFNNFGNQGGGFGGGGGFGFGR